MIPPALYLQQDYPAEIYLYFQVVKFVQPVIFHHHFIQQFFAYFENCCFYFAFFASLPAGRQVCEKFDFFRTGTSRISCISAHKTDRPYFHGTFPDSCFAVHILLVQPFSLKNRGTFCRMMHGQKEQL